MCPKRAGGGRLVRAVHALVEARRRDARPFGQILGDAVRDSVQTLLMVGGFVILFAVVIDILTRIGLVAWVSAGLAWLLHPVGIGQAGASSLVSGLFEITIGAKAASAAPGPLLQRLVLCNAIIAWSGLSVFAQVAAVSQGTGISLRPYVLARVLQSVLAGALTFWFWNPAWASGGGSVAATARLLPAAGGAGGWAAHVSWPAMFDQSCLLLGGILLVGAVAVALYALRRGMGLAWWRVGRARGGL